MDIWQVVSSIFTIVLSLQHKEKWQSSTQRYPNVSCWTCFIQWPLLIMLLRLLCKLAEECYSCLPCFSVPPVFSSHNTSWTQTLYCRKSFWRYIPLSAGDAGNASLCRNEKMQTGSTTEKVPFCLCKVKVRSYSIHVKAPSLSTAYTGVNTKQKVETLVLSSNIYSIIQCDVLSIIQLLYKWHVPSGSFLKYYPTCVIYMTPFFLVAHLMHERLT